MLPDPVIQRHRGKAHQRMPGECFHQQVMVRAGTTPLVNLLSFPDTIVHFHPPFPERN
jgi:hypothetical protein